MLPILKNQKLRCVLPGETFGSLTRFLDDVFPEIPLWRETGTLDLYEDEKNLYVEVELPGYSKDQIELTLEEGVLHLKAESKDEKECRPRENYYIRERRHGRWSRSIQLPVPVQEDEVTATFNDGVVQITLAKQVDKPMHKIPVT